MLLVLIVVKDQKLKSFQIIIHIAWALFNNNNNNNNNNMGSSVILN